MFKARFYLFVCAFLCFHSLSLSSFAGSLGFKENCTEDSNCQDAFKCELPYPGSTDGKQCILRESCLSTDYCKTTYYSKYISANSTNNNFVCSGPVYSDVSDSINGVKTADSEKWDYGACVPDQSAPNGTCSAAQPCQAGFVCERSTCVPNSITKVLCNINLYFTDKLAVRFMQFSSVMLGFAFFLGKISWGMIMTIMLGSSLVIGAEQLVSKLAGFDTNSSFCNFNAYCSPDKIEYSSSSISVSANIGSEVTKLYNMSMLAGNSSCADPLSCTSYSCALVQKDTSGNCSPMTSDVTKFTSVIWMPNSDSLNTVVSGYLNNQQCANFDNVLPSYQPEQFCVPSFYKANLNSVGITSIDEVAKVNIKYFLCDLTCSNNEQFGGIDASGNATAKKTLACQLVQNKLDSTIYNNVNNCADLKKIDYTGYCSTY